MTVLQAFFDESGKQSDHPLIAVCCVCGTSAQMNKFDDYWRALLEKHSVSDLHMKRASDYKRSWGTLPKQTVEERIEGLKPFADCMGENLQFGLIEAWDVKGFKAIPAQARNKIGNPQDPYYLAFARALLDFPDHAGEDDVLSLICDHDEESAWDSYRHYRGIRRASTRVREKTASISFADDKFFPALQAADMVAFLTRHEAREEFYEIRNLWLPLFDYMVRDRGPGKMEWQKMFANEQKARNCLRPRSEAKLINLLANCRAARSFA